MLLRSSSSPVIGTLLPLSSEGPNRDLDAINKNNKPIKNAPFLNFSHGLPHPKLKSFSCNSSQIENSSSGYRESNRESNVNSGPKNSSIHRAQSKGNLVGY